MNIEKAIRDAFRAGGAYTVGSNQCFKQTHPDENEYVSKCLEELPKYNPEAEMPIEEQAILISKALNLESNLELLTRKHEHMAHERIPSICRNTWELTNSLIDDALAARKVEVSWYIQTRAMSISELIWLLKFESNKYVVTKPGRLSAGVITSEEFQRYLCEENYQGPYTLFVRNQITHFEVC